MYVKYEVQEYNTNHDRPFEITIYFQNQTGDGTWVAPTYVVDQGRIVNVTLRLGENLAILNENSSIPPDMNIYLGAYARTLQSLSAFSPQGQPQSLSEVKWGVRGCIGCQTPNMVGNETIQVQAGTFHTTVLLVDHYGLRDSKIWIDRNLPFPVKALTYTHLSDYPIRYAFELIDIGIGKPKIPPTMSVFPQPPLTLSTVSNYRISLEWSPQNPPPSTPTTFTIHFKDNYGRPLSNVDYDFMLQSPYCTILEDRGKTSDIQGLANLTVPSTHVMWDKIVITINSIDGQSTANQENAAFVLVSLQGPYGSNSQSPEECQDEHTRLTTNGTIPVDVSIAPIWSTGGNVQFNITFYQTGTNTTQGVCFNSTITNTDTNKTIDRASEHFIYTAPNTPHGICGVDSTLEPPDKPVMLEKGNYMLDVYVYGQGNMAKDSNKPARVQLPIQVIPEFPILNIVLIIPIAALIIISYFKR